MTEKESLEIIVSMLDRTKSNLREQSGFYMIWGWSIFLASSIEYVALIFFEFEYHFMVWPIAILVAVTLTIFKSSRMASSKRTMTYADRSLAYLWSAWSALLFIILLFTGMGGLSWGSSYAFIIALYGMGTTVSGGILRFRPLVLGGIFSFVLSFLALILKLTSNPGTMLLFLALSILGSYLVPAYLLKRA